MSQYTMGCILSLCNVTSALDIDNEDEEELRGVRTDESGRGFERQEEGRENFEVDAWSEASSEHHSNFSVDEYDNDMNQLNRMGRSLSSLVYSDLQGMFSYHIYT